MTSTSPGPALLILEDGTIFVGKQWGAAGTALGELVFTTGMTGYQETLTDPSYHRQIIVMTSPHIGNTGMNDEDVESDRIWAGGIVVRDPARRSSSWRSQRELETDLCEQNIIGISEVDTRAITRHIREKGAMRCGIFSGQSLPTEVHQSGGHWVPEQTRAAFVAHVRSHQPMTGSGLVEDVTSAEAYSVPAQGEEKAHIVAVDLGIKSRTPEQLAQRGARLTVVPAGVSAQQILDLAPDAVFFSNGPGDPATADHQVEVLREVLRHRIPFFGICFGHQLFGRALGFDTYKLRFGHRGVNQPIRDLTTGKVEITSHNHGFAVDAPVGEPVPAPEAEFGRVQVSHVNLNDQVVEGLRALDLPAFSVQFHPEAAAGPHDGEHLFDRFMHMIAANAGKEN
ncbi:MAG: glutamine-hydrolyzing carbamoyl-phosphate synthase small subunit [Actinomycetaceae bacterium]|nr:glutamine-hydrolyzing carbamoyl-phosphate synthase small subunit [Actinomycetaceae bacterium]